MAVRLNFINKLKNNMLGKGTSYTAFVILLLYLCDCLLALSSVEALSAEHEKDQEMRKAERLPPCASCKVLVDSFKKGMERTARGKFDGGDAAWEESKMGSYKRSEVRLVEVQEKLCSEVERGQNQCLKAAEDNEGILENWWFNLQDTNSDLYSVLCIEQLQACCPKNHFGPDCSPCLGGVEEPCSGNGRCKGSGTRKGNGQCDCNKGFTGDLCDTCATGYYESYRDQLKMLCDPCHKACLGPCSGAGSKSCVACQPGWLFDTEKGCLDRNECILDDPCKEGQYCINTDGNYTCQKCHVACDGCNGDGADMCIKCAEGFMEDDGFCVDTAPTKAEEAITFARYVTYLGLTIATCIILQKHTTIAAFVGLSASIYISFSEYYLTHLDSGRKGAQRQNTLEFDD